MAPPETFLIVGLISYSVTNSHYRHHEMTFWPPHYKMLGTPLVAVNLVSVAVSLVSAAVSLVSVAVSLVSVAVSFAVRVFSVAVSLVSVAVNLVSVAVSLVSVLKLNFTRE